jgi:hypothetical protein
VSVPPVSSAERSAARAQRALDLVRVFAREPRAAGGEAEARARAYCAQQLRAAGFEVSEEPFEYSAFPGRWGTPVGGIIALVLVTSASAAGRAGEASFAVLILTLGAGALGVLARWLARTGVLAFPLQRRRWNLSRRVATDRMWSHESAACAPRLRSPSRFPFPCGGNRPARDRMGHALSLAVLQLASGRGSMTGAWLAVNGVAILAAIPVIATTVGGHRVRWTTRPVWPRCSAVAEARGHISVCA